MVSTAPIQSLKTQKIWSRTYVKRFLKFLFIFWPVFAIYFFVPKLYLLLEHWISQEVALHLAFIGDFIVLGLTFIFHRFKWGKSFSILLSIGLCIKKVTLSSGYIFRKCSSHPELLGDIFYHHTGYILINILLIIVTGKAVQYLWVNCSYNETFALHKIRFIRVPGSWSWRFKVKCNSIANEIFRNLNVGFFHKILEYKEWLISFWFVPIIYSFWFKQYFFLYPGSDALQFFKYLQVMVVPLGVLFIALFLFNPCKLINRFGVVLAAVTHIGAQVYAIVRYINYYRYHWSIIVCKESSVVTFKQVSHFLDDLSSWIVLLDLFLFSVGICVLIKLGAPQSKNKVKSQPFKGSTNYGTAKFLDLKGIRKINSKNGIPIGAIPKTTDFIDPHKVIKSIKKQGGNELIRLKSSHTTLVAPSRTGKGTGIIIPTLLEYPGPVFVTDVKGENYPITRRMRESKGRNVIAFDPFIITEAPRIKLDPLKILDPNSMEIVEDAQTLSKLLCPDYEHDGTNIGHFRAQAGALIQCLLLYVVCSEQILPEERTLSKVYDLLCLPFEEQTNLMYEIAKQEWIAYGTASRIANGISSTHHEEKSGIFSTARVEMRFMDTPQIREAISGSDILLSDITKGDMDLFVCIPLEKLATQHRLLRLITGIVFIEMQKARGRIGEHNLLMVLDEMPALGRMKQVEEILVYGGGFGISLLAVSQTIEFLQSVYPNTWKTFFSNQLSIFFGCSEPMTSKFVAEKLDKRTIEIASVNQSTGTQDKSKGLSGTASLQIGDSLSEGGRELLMPGEIERLGDRVVLAFMRGEDPILCHRIDYRERSEWMGMWDENPLHASRQSHNQYSLTEYFERLWQILTS